PQQVRVVHVLGLRILLDDLLRQVERPAELRRGAQVRLVERVGNVVEATLVVALREIQRVVVHAARQQRDHHRCTQDPHAAGAQCRPSVSCNADTSSGPRRSASIPDTAASAPATVVITGTPSWTARSRMAFSSNSDARPSGVLSTSWISP